MARQGWTAWSVAALREATALLDQATRGCSSFTAQLVSPDASLTLGVATAAVAGLVIAAVLGGTLLFSLRRKQKRSPLTAIQWYAAFDSVSGRLNNQHEILEKIRFGGIDSSIRAQVWPFILGFRYQLDKAPEQQEAEKHGKRDFYIDLKVRCNLLRANMHEVMSESENSSKNAEVSSDGLNASEEHKNAASGSDDDPSSSTKEQTEDIILSPNMHEVTSESEDVMLRANMHEVMSESEDRNKNGEVHASEEHKNGALGSDDDDPSSSTKDPSTQNDRRVLAPCDTKEEDLKQDEEPVHTKSASDFTRLAHTDLKTDCLKATEDFMNCQRIIRVDAVRMNAEWVPYSPSQANVTKEAAFELARIVDLRDDDHLEPCRQHHAARLVAILEAYALHDPETGYCQGMSDLLSPFVALLDEDYEAFWCFVQFMGTARFNFRSDEIGIRRQLNKISSIFKAADPHLYSHLESIGSENCFFVYRMVVVLLRRELTFEQTISLWEIIWAEQRALIVRTEKVRRKKPTRRNVLTEDLILFVIAAAVRQKRKVIMEECGGMGELLRECNSMAGNLDVWKLLNDARDLAYKVQGQL